MVVVDRLREVAHFIPAKTTNSLNEVTQVFTRHIVRMHGIPKKFISYKDSNLSSKFWKDLFVGLGTNFAFSITYHPQTDGQTKRINKILEDMLWMYVMHQQ